MKTAIFKITFDDEGGYKGHGEDTVDVIEHIIKNEISVSLEDDSVIKKDWTIEQINIEETEQLLNEALNKAICVDRIKPDSNSIAIFLKNFLELKRVRNRER